VSPVLNVLILLLIPAGLLPIGTAWVLRRYRHSDSQALRDRWHLALVLALLGAIISLLAGLRLLDIRLGEIGSIPFIVVLLAVDLVSGRWLIDFYQGRFR
jgi:hypothetical protein